MFATTALSLLVFGAAITLDDTALPQPVAEALSASVNDGQRDDWRFSISITSGETAVLGRFDGTLPEDEQWTLISPSQEEMDDELRAIWEDIIDPSEDEDEGSGLFFSTSDFEYEPGSLNLLESNGGLSHFTFTPVLDAEEAEMAEHLTGVLTVSDDPARVQQIRIYAEESFKPNFAVRVNAFELRQYYQQFEGLPAPVMTRMVQHVEASAAFQTFEQGVEIEFSDIEYLAE